MWLNRLKELDTLLILIVLWVFSISILLFSWFSLCLIPNNLMFGYILIKFSGSVFNILPDLVLGHYSFEPKLPWAQILNWTIILFDGIWILKFSNNLVLFESQISLMEPNCFNTYIFHHFAVKSCSDKRILLEGYCRQCVVTSMFHFLFIQNIRAFAFTLLLNIGRFIC